MSLYLMTMCFPNTHYGYNMVFSYPSFMPSRCKNEVTVSIIIMTYVGEHYLKSRWLCRSLLGTLWWGHCHFHHTSSSSQRTLRETKAVKMVAWQKIWMFSGRDGRKTSQRDELWQDKYLTSELYYFMIKSTAKNLVPPAALQANCTCSYSFCSWSVT